MKIKHAIALKIGHRTGLILSLAGAGGLLLYGIPEIFVLLPHWLRHEIWRWGSCYKPIFCIGIVLALGSKTEH